jgi:hypothetical protein
VLEEPLSGCAEIPRTISGVRAHGWALQTFFIFTCKTDPRHWQGGIF